MLHQSVPECRASPWQWPFCLWGEQSHTHTHRESRQAVRSSGWRDDSAHAVPPENSSLAPNPSGCSETLVTLATEIPMPSSGLFRCSHRLTYTPKSIFIIDFGMHITEHKMIISRKVVIGLLNQHFLMLSHFLMDDLTCISHRPFFR